MPGKGATHQRVICSTPSPMIEDVLDVEMEVDSDKADTVDRPKSITPANGKRTRVTLESSAEWGVILLDQAIVTARLNKGIVENLATTKRSAKRRSESRLQPADSSRTMHRIPTTTIIAECL